MMKFLVMFVVAGMTEGSPVRTVVRYGILSHELKGPWSPVSRTQLNSKFPLMLFPPPKPSKKLTQALGPCPGAIEHDVVG